MANFDVYVGVVAILFGLFLLCFNNRAISFVSPSNELNLVGMALIVLGIGIIFVVRKGGE